MKKLSLFLAILWMFAGPCYGGTKGTYHIEKDEQGLYIQTDGDGTWYVEDSADQAIKMGETGTYYIMTDDTGSYLITDKHGKFRIEQEVNEELEKEIMGFDRKAEWGPGSRVSKVIIKGNQVLVPVALGYGQTEVKTYLLLDTGASIMALHEDLVRELNIRESLKAKFRAVGGRIITTKLAKLSYVRVGPFVKKNIYAGIINHQGSTVQYKGLLGMNFLRGLEFRIDFQNHRIEWKP